ncbi:MAG: lytic transglycosylase domain-containing protein [Syntrophomonadaceae bacterium]
MKRNAKPRFPTLLWLMILVFLAIILTFPKWITFFYPQPHRELVVATAYEYNIDPYLVFAIIRAESKYQTGAQSSVGARGLMQIMPETAQWISSQMGTGEFDPVKLHDPEINIRMGCWYLADLSKEFDGRIPIIVAAYNAGRGKVKQWVVNDEWDGTAHNIEKIPFPETREYVHNVLKNYEAYRAIYE